MRTMMKLAAMRRVPLGLVAFTVLSAGIVGAAVAPRQAGAPIELRLRAIREVRVAEFGEKESGWNSSGPGLELALDPVLPEGAKIVSISQPGSPKATDSAGTDLTKIAPDFWDKMTYVKLEEFGSDEGSLTVRLSLPARKAETFSAVLTCEAMTFDGVDSVDIPVPERWTKLTHPSLAKYGAEAKLETDEDGGARLRLRPAAAREVMEGVYPATDETDQSGYAISYDDEVATFEVTPAPEKGQKVRLKVRRNVEVRPLVIELKDQKLP